ncbi:MULTISPECIES: hypothetical protein [Klebsiella]|uniref:Uncharacterized protein n=1 Tax=Klebsiella michiganensis TaxID=1134687 RepID=A0AAJ1L0P3_9ENTR|nr:MULTISPECIES: hypothetical protein [Klebsiella]EKW0786009.1 hypothetical protein [Klebsiella michiganensis]MDH0967323.1 hypothetical protein [Klebsiella michiganensis]MDI3171986.1 hypothetical protein [Klebsiella michiganensis]MDM4126538.1 hypothetical protein [Klebsiella michiganensis]MDM4163396.1 hypothetical protein [Klebsiella michiganensis]
MILVDLDHRYKKIEKSVSEGIFSVDFIKGKDLAYIGTNQGLFFNLANGKLRPVDPEFDPRKIARGSLIDILRGSIANRLRKRVMITPSRSEHGVY